jgi:Arc/MetJ-type ribon-helix-helix transcriptional regulator
MKADRSDKVGNAPTAKGNDHEAMLAALRAALVEGKQSGRAGSLDMEMFLREKRASYESRSKP